MANNMHPLGAPRAGYAWSASAREVDMATPPAKPVPLRIAAAPQNITIDLKRSAMVVIDMQNDFCTEGGWVDSLGVDYTPDRKPIKPLQKLLPALRKAGVPVIWVNWGTRPDLANIPPNQIHLYKPKGSGFWDTPLDSILRNLGTRTVLFSGVNTDQCVLHSLTDANFLGYGCVLVEDCCGTTSPDFCTEATVWNVKKCFGFVTDSGKILKALKK